MELYAPQYNMFSIIDRVRMGTRFIFWTIFMLSITPAILERLGIVVKIDDLINTINIICIGLFFVLEIIIDYVLVPQADSKRRDDFIDNSFGSIFSPNSSIGYFDTDEIKLGLYKAACNLFENCFFTYNLIKTITIRKTVVPALVLLSITVFAYYGFKQVPFALSLLQALFSATLLGGLIKHFILMIRLHTIQDSWIILFQYKDFKTNPEKYKAHIYRYWLQYETLHSRIQAGIPNKIFKKMNNILTEEWIK